MDSYADEMLKYHLGYGTYRTDSGHPYRAFVANFTALNQLSGCAGPPRTLDRYLWLAGQYRTWRANPKAPINTELKQLFEDPPAEAADALGVMLPSAR